MWTGFALDSLGERWICARKSIYNSEIRGGSKESRSKVNTHSCSLYTGAYLGNHKVFPLPSLFARLSEYWSKSRPASPRDTSGSGLNIFLVKRFSYE